MWPVTVIPRQALRDNRNEFGFERLINLHLFIAEFVIAVHDRTGAICVLCVFAR
jgi:hypothetical protein